MLDRVLSRVEVGDCWEWTGATDKYGYGVINRSVYGKFYVHRFVWTQLVGPIPEGLVIDHLCRNVVCCNPDHLEPVGRVENILRGVFGGETCRQGHSDWHIAPNGRRVCSECRRLNYRKKHNVTKERGPYRKNVNAICIEGAGFATTTRDGNAAVIRVEEWDASKDGWCAK